MGEQTNQQLVEYIRQSRRSGVADDQIRRALLGAGWSESDIDAAFVEVSSLTQQPNLPAANQQATNQPGSSSAGLLSATELLKASFRVLKGRYFDALKLFIIPIAIFLVIFLILVLAGFMAGSNPVGWGLSHLTAQIYQNAPIDSGSYPYSFDKPSFSPILFVFILILLIAGLIFYTITTIALIRLFGKDEPLKFSEYLKFGVANFWSYIWVVALASIIVVGGMVLLIVPGIIFSVWFSLGVYALLLEGHRGRAALLRSKQLVSGMWGSVFWRFLFFGIISQLILLPFYIISAFSKSTGNFLTYTVNILLIFPLSLAYGASLFRNLFQVKAGLFVEDKKAANKFTAVGVLGWVVLFVLMGFFLFKMFSAFKSLPPSSDSGTYQGTNLGTIETAGWQTYRNEEYGFEVRYPQKWFVSDNLKLPNGKQLSGVKQIVISREKRDIAPRITETPDGLWLAILKDYGNEPLCTVGTGEQFIIDGKKYIRCQDIYPQDNKRVYIIQVHLPSEEKVINFFYPVADAAIIDQILPTFKFI